MADWTEALRVIGVGLGVVFAVMALIAVATWLSGRVFVRLEDKQKAREKAKAPKGGGSEAEAGAPDGGGA